MSLLDTLSGLHIAVPESRQLDVLNNLFERRGAKVFSCPLVSIHDTPEQEMIQLWMTQFIENTPDYLIILTGEGIKRLSSFAERFDCSEAWAEALGRTHKLARGPKPNRALKPLKLQADQLAVEPTTDGIIKTLNDIDLDGKTVAVQLYGDNPNDKLQDYLLSRSVNYHTVAPYVYASDAETDRVLELIEGMYDQSIDMICFTSQPQYQRLASVAKKHAIEDKLHQAMQCVKIAAVGPVVAEQLQAKGYTVSYMPTDQFFMKPMVSAISD